MGETAQIMKTAIELKIGESSVIDHFNGSDISSQFVGIGCLPKSAIQLIRKGPGGKTMYFIINGSAFALRTEEAKNIILKY